MFAAMVEGQEGMAARALAGVQAAGGYPASGPQNLAALVQGT